MKSRNAGYILIAAKGGDTTTLCTFSFITLLHNLPPTGGHNLRRSRAFFIPDTYVLSARLYDQRGEKAWRKGFPIPAVHNPWKREGKTGNLHEFLLSGAPKTP